MASAIESNQPSIASSNHWRLPGVDFDLDGRESTLKELLRMGGFFPLVAIKDRLPFSEKTIRRWAETRPDALSACVVPIMGKRGKRILTLVHLGRLEEFLNGQVNAGVVKVIGDRSGSIGDLVEGNDGSVAG